MRPASCNALPLPIDYMHAINCIFHLRIVLEYRGRIVLYPPVIYPNHYRV